MEVERSNDTQDWISVYRTNGAGNSLEETTYEGIDFNVPKVPLYYRLKQVDYDGDIEFINVHLKIVDNFLVRITSEIEVTNNKYSHQTKKPKRV